MVHFGEFLKTWSLRSNSVTRQVSFKIGQKLMNNAEIKCDILGDFQTLYVRCTNNCNTSLLYWLIIFIFGMQSNLL